MKTLFKTLIALSFVVIVAGCDVTAKPTADYVATEAPREEILAKTKELRKDFNLNLAKVMVVKLKVDGAPLDVSSIQPVIFPLKGWQEEKPSTVMTIDTKNNLFGIYTATNDKGYKLELDLAEIPLEAGEMKEIDIPLINKDGEVMTSKIELSHYLSRP